MAFSTVKEELLSDDDWSLLPGEENTSLELLYYSQLSAFFE